MAWLTCIATGKRHIISPSFLVGRSHACALRLDSRRVSGEHATLRWNGSGWTVRDLHSSNGTFVDERQVEPGQTTPIRAGMRIAFGDQANLFELTDDSPPVAVARPVEGEPLLAQEGVLCLPEQGDPEYFIFEDDPGIWPGRWFVESRDGSCRRLGDREELCSGGRIWRIELPLMWERTSRRDETSLHIANIGLRIRVSSNEEHVEITIRHAGAEIPLPPRSHGYLLATLARQRVSDATKPGLAEADHGWVYVSDLMRMLDTSEMMINVFTRRARVQFQEANVIDAANLIERRRTSREMRLGVRDIELVT
jgi:hypothetical protein